MLRLSVLTLLLFAAFEASAWKHKDYLQDGECQLFPHPTKDKHNAGANPEWAFQIVLQNIEDAQCCAHLRTYLEGALARGLSMDRAWHAIYSRKINFVDSCRVEDEDGACGDSPPSFQDNNPGEPVHVADNDAMAKAQAYICSKPSCSYGSNVGYWVDPQDEDLVASNDGISNAEFRLTVCEGDEVQTCQYESNKNFCADVLMCGQDDLYVPFELGTNINGVVLQLISGSGMSHAMQPHKRPAFDYFNTNSTEMFACDRTDNQHYAEVPIGSGIVPDRNFGQQATKKELLGCSDRDVNAVVKRQVARVSGALESVAREIRLVSNSLVGHHAAKKERSAPPTMCAPGQSCSKPSCSWGELGTAGTECSICQSGDAYGRTRVNSTQFPSGTLEFNAEDGAAVLDETGAWIPDYVDGPAGYKRPPKVKNAAEITVETTLFHGDPAFDQNDFVRVNGYNPVRSITVIERKARFTVKEGYIYTYGLNGAVTEAYIDPGHETCWKPGDGPSTFVTAHGRMADDDVLGWYRPGSSNYVTDRTVLTDYEFQAPLKDNFQAAINSGLTMTGVYIFASPSGVYSGTPSYKYYSNWGLNAVTGPGTNWAAIALNPLDGTSDCSPLDEPAGPTWSPYRCNNFGYCQIYYSEPLHFTGEAGGVTFDNTFMGRFAATISPDTGLIGTFISKLVLSPSSMVLLVDDLGRFVQGSTEAIDEVFQESSAGALAFRNQPFLNCVGMVTVYTAALQDQDGVTGEWQAVMDDVGAVGKAGDVVTASRDFTVTRQGSGPTNHHFSYYVFPESGEDGFKLPPWVLLALVPRVELDAAADWKMESKVAAATSAEHPVEAVGATFSIENTGLVDLVFTIEDLPGWARIEWANGTDFELGKGHTIAGDFQYGEFATPNEKAELRIFFTGTGEEHEVLLAPMSVLVADDGFPDCFKEVTQSVSLEFDNRNPCLGGLDIASAVEIEAAKCGGTVSGSGCPLICDDSFTGSAASVVCVDGIWEKQSCALDEDDGGYTQYIVIPIGAVFTVIVVFIVARKQDLAMTAVMAMMKDTVILFGSITLEIMDIVSDLVVLIAINQDKSLEKYMSYYALFFGTGTAMFLCHVMMNALYLIRLFTKVDVESIAGLTKSVLDRRSKKKKGGKTAAVGNDSRVHSIGLSDSGEALELNHLRRAFCENAHEAKVLEARVNRIMGLLALLFFEDIPMLVLNLMVVSEFTTNPVAGRSSTPILLSMTIGNMMVAFKASSTTGIGSMRQALALKQEQCLQLLADIGKSEALQSQT